MSEENAIQKDEIYLKGNLGYMVCNGKIYARVEVCENINSRSVTYTLRPELNDINKTEDADFEIIPPNQLPNTKE